MADKKRHKDRVADVRTMTADELQDELVKLKKEQFNLRFQAATGQLQSTARIGEVRRMIAVVKTVMRRRAIDAVAAAQGS